MQPPPPPPAATYINSMVTAQTITTPVVSSANSKSEWQNGTEPPWIIVARPGAYYNFSFRTLQLRWWATTTTFCPVYRRRRCRCFRSTITKTRRPGTSSRRIPPILSCTTTRRCSNSRSPRVTIFRLLTAAINTVRSIDGVGSFYAFYLFAYKRITNERRRGDIFSK